MKCPKCGGPRFQVQAHEIAGRPPDEQPLVTVSALVCMDCESVVGVVSSAEVRTRLRRLKSLLERVEKEIAAVQKAVKQLRR